jgi:hypothetical protein
MKKIREDKPIGVIIHAHVEISQGTSLCSYLYLFFFFYSYVHTMFGSFLPAFPPLSQTSKNVMVFFLIFLFFFYKIREQEGRTDPEGIGTSEGERCLGKAVEG